MKQFGQSRAGRLARWAAAASVAAIVGVGLAPAASAYNFTSTDTTIGGSGANALDDTNVSGGNLGNLEGSCSFCLQVINNYEVANYEMVVLVNGVDVPDGYNLKVGDVITWRWTIRDASGSSERWYSESSGNISPDKTNVRIKVDLPGATGTYLSAPTVQMQQYSEKGASGGSGANVDPLTPISLGAVAVGNSSMSASQSGNTIEAKWDSPPTSSVAAVHEVWTGQELTITQTVTDLPNSTAQSVAYANPRAGLFGDSSNGGYRSWVAGNSFEAAYANYNLVLPVGQVDLGVSVTAAPTTVCSADGADQVTYTVTATNSTNLPNQDNADNVVVTTPLGNLTAARIAPGASASKTFTVTVPPGLTSLSATLNSVSPSDNNPANNTGTATVTVLPDGDGDGLCAGGANPDPDDGNACIPNPGTNPACAVADLTLVKTYEAPDGTENGDTVTYTIVATNSGPDTSKNVVVNDLLPAGVTFVSSSPSTGSFNPATGVWSVGDLANAATASLQITVTVTDASPDGTSIANQACVSSDTTDPTPSNNCSTATFTGTPLVDPLAAAIFGVPAVGLLALRRRRRQA